MSSRRWLVVSIATIAIAFAISAFLYGASRAVDFDAHARVLEAMGRVRTLDRLQSEEVLEARFGILNQYDSINATGGELESAEKELAARSAAVVGDDSKLRAAVASLEATLAVRKDAIERFKRESSILRNSTYYLPVAAHEVELHWNDAAPGTSVAIQRMTETGLAYNLVGDASARDAHARALAELRGLAGGAPDTAKGSLSLFLAHGDAILREVPAVDDWMSRATTLDSLDALDAVDAAYEARFDAMAMRANRYRMMLYGWSLVLLVGVAAAGVQLRRVYAGLETRVAERTGELRRALAALWGEMKLARRIQEALVPAAPALEACDVAARMQPTDDVGGDYYDVIRAGDCEWILIGDVSGHGVPAGLIMMMCHTAVRTALRQDPALGPARLLGLVNRVLVDAIRQLGEDKYMTITALRRAPDGSVRFAGAHQDLHVLRAGRAEVETIESSGVWLGIVADIEHTLVERELRLAEGDVLVLHTDGITEAAGAGERFDERGLRAVLERAAGSSAGEIVSKVFDSLAAYELRDDATVLVLRQLEPPVRFHGPANGAPSSDRTDAAASRRAT